MWSWVVRSFLWKWHLPLQKANKFLRKVTMATCSWLCPDTPLKTSPRKIPKSIDCWITKQWELLNYSNEEFGLDFTLGWDKLIMSTPCGVFPVGDKFISSHLKLSITKSQFINEHQSSQTNVHEELEGRWLSIYDSSPLFIKGRIWESKRCMKRVETFECGGILLRFVEVIKCNSNNTAEQLQYMETKSSWNLDFKISFLFNFKCYEIKYNATQRME